MQKRSKRLGSFLRKDSCHILFITVVRIRLLLKNINYYFCANMSSSRTKRIILMAKNIQTGYNEGPIINQVNNIVGICIIYRLTFLFYLDL